jgi:hypothetical protein
VLLTNRTSHNENIPSARPIGHRTMRIYFRCDQ